MELSKLTYCVTALRQQLLHSLSQTRKLTYTNEISEPVPGRFKTRINLQATRAYSLHINILSPYANTKRRLTPEISIMGYSKSYIDLSFDLT